MSEELFRERVLALLERIATAVEQHPVLSLDSGGTIPPSVPDPIP